MATLTLQSHVALLAFPFGTHAAPLFSLACRLAASLPATLFSFFTTATSKASLSALISASAASTPNITVFTVHDGLPENFVPTGKRREHIDYFLAAIPGNFWKGFESVQAAGLPRIGLILSDSFLCFAPEMAAEMGVPWISFWTSSPTSLAAHFHTQTIRERLGFRDDDDSGLLLFHVTQCLGLYFLIQRWRAGQVQPNKDSFESGMPSRSGQKMELAAVL